MFSADSKEVDANGGRKHVITGAIAKAINAELSPALLRTRMTATSVVQSMDMPRSKLYLNGQLFKSAHFLIVHSLNENFESLRATVKNGSSSSRFEPDLEAKYHDKKIYFLTQFKRPGSEKDL
jgi:hypothetical protein